MFTLYHLLQKFCKMQENIITCWFCERSEIVSMSVNSRWMRRKKIIQTPLYFGQRSKCFGLHLDEVSSAYEAMSLYLSPVSLEGWACNLALKNNEEWRNVNGQIIHFNLPGKKKNPLIFVFVLKEEAIFNRIANGQNSSPEMWNLACFNSHLLSKVYEDLWEAFSSYSL